METNGQAMSRQYAAIRVSDPGVKLTRIHDRIVAAIHAGDKPAERCARRCYRRALARVEAAERWRRRNGHRLDPRTPE